MKVLFQLGRSMCSAERRGLLVLGATLLGSLAALADGAPAAAQGRAPAAPAEESVPPAPAAESLPRLNDAAAYVARAAASATKGQTDAALSDYGAALALDAKNVAALKGRADLYLALKRYGEAAGDYGTLVELDDKAGRYHDRGWAYYLDGKYELARDDFDEMLRFDRNDVEGHRLRGMAYEARAATYGVGTAERTRLYNQARFDYETALRVKRDDVDALRVKRDTVDLLARLAGLYNALGQYQKAVEKAEAAIALDAKHAPAFLARADARFGLGDYPHAIEDYTQAVTLDGSSPDWFEKRAIAYKSNGDWDAAFADYGKAIELDANNPLRYNARANACYARGDYETSIADYNHCIMLVPTEPQYWENRANARRQAGHWDDSFEDYTRAIALDRNNASRYNARGDGYYYHGDYVESIVDYDEAIRLEPSNALYIENKAISLRLLGQTAESKSYYEEAVKLAPEDAARRVARGFAYKAWGDSGGALADYEQAITDFTKAIALAPTVAVYYEYRADATRAAGRFAESLPDYAKAIQLDPQNTARYLARAKAYRSQEKFAEAIADFDRALALNPDKDTYNLRGICYEGMNDDAKAVESYTAAIELAADDAVIVGNRAVVNIRLHDYDAARADAQRAIELDATDARNYNTLGDAYYYPGDYAKAEEQYALATRARRDGSAVLGEPRVCPADASRGGSPGAVGGVDRGLHEGDGGGA